MLEQPSVFKEIKFAKLAKLDICVEEQLNVSKLVNLVKGDKSDTCVEEQRSVFNAFKFVKCDKSTNSMFSQSINFSNHTHSTISPGISVIPQLPRSR